MARGAINALEGVRCSRGTIGRANKSSSFLSAEEDAAESEAADAAALIKKCRPRPSN